MKKYITYSDIKYVKQRNFSVFMAKLLGNFDDVTAYTPDDIDNEFYEKNINILSQGKGGGFWLWKPYFIYKTLKTLNEGDFLFYADAGSFFLKSVDQLIDELSKSNQHVMGFELPLIESQWTKKELFKSLNCEGERFPHTNQILASFILIKKSDFSMSIFKEYLDSASCEINITDVWNKKEQDKDFIEHRHDQSIFSLLYKKHKLKPFKDPSQFGSYPYGYGDGLQGDLLVDKLHVLNNGRKFRYFNYNEKYSNVLFHYRRGNPLIKLIWTKVKIMAHESGFRNILLLLKMRR